MPGDRFEDSEHYVTKTQLAGLTYLFMDEPDLALASYDSARIVLEGELEERPDDHRVLSSLGIVYAGLGRKEDAIRAGEKGAELSPVSRDALAGPIRLLG